MTNAAPPYRRIADDLRRRIRAGELAPGARVPSTRALAKQWGVASATAAHALRELTHEGVLRALPRSGTVVAKPRGGAIAAREPELTRERIIAAALAIADDEGLPALSIRSLAARLGAPAMSLYRHVRSKEQLIALMTDAALGERPLPQPPPRGWRAQLAAGARAEWAVLQRHPWLARVVNVTRPQPMPSAMRMADWVMRALDRSPLDAAGKLEVHVLLHAFVQGLAVNLEAEAQALGDTGITEEEHMRRNEAAFAALAGTGRYPYFAKMMAGMPVDFEVRLDALFETGLSALLDGLTPRIEGRLLRR